MVSIADSDSVDSDTRHGEYVSPSIHLWVSVKTIKKTPTNLIELTEHSPTMLNPSNMLIKLKTHQLTAITGLHSFEQQGGITIEDYFDSYFVTTNTLFIKSNYGIFSDMTGSGKTLSIIGLISHSVLTPYHPRISHSSFGCSISTKNKSVSIIKTNLILVPHNLISQWTTSLTYTKLKSYIIARTIDITTLYNSTEPIDHYDIILCSFTMYEDFYNKNKFLTHLFSRIVIDEIASIKLPSKILSEGNFIWFITATPKELLYSRKQFVCKYFNDAKFFHRSYDINLLCIKNVDSFVEHSLSLPKYNKFILKFIPPQHLNVIRNFVSSDILDMLNAGNYEEAILKLNCNIDTEENIFEILTRKLRNDIHNANEELRYLTNIISTSDQHAESIIRVKSKINSLQTNYDAIKSRIHDFNLNNCPICFEDFINTKTVVMPCCNQLFCINCISKLVISNCPFCRSPFSINNIHIINDKQITHSSNTNVTKIEIVIKLILNNPLRKFLLFSSYDNTFKKIEHQLSANNISHFKLSGHMSTINSAISNFDNGIIKVLMLNAVNYGSGLNLQMATDIIIFHRLNPELESQVIGRAQRIGRSSELNIHYLYYDDELSHNSTIPISDLSVNSDSVIQQYLNNMSILHSNNSLSADQSIQYIDSFVSTPVPSKQIKKRTSRSHK